MRLELALLAALGVSLGAKLAVNDYRVDIDHQRVTREIAQSLVQSGYRTAMIPRNGRPATIAASLGDCQLLVQSAFAPASLSGAYVRDFAPVGSPAYRIGTTEYLAPPSARIWIGDMIQYSLGRAGIFIERNAPIVLARSKGCLPGQPDLSAIRIGLYRTEGARSDRQ